MEAPRHVLLQNVDDEQICTICQEDVSLADGYALQCGHVFHEKARAPKPKRRKVAVPVVGATEGASPAAAARPAVSGAVPVDDEPSDERAATAPVSMLSPTLPAPLPSTS